MPRHVTQKEWNGFVASRPHAEFMQSWEWGESACARDRAEILRIAFPDEGPLRAACQLIERGQGTPFHYWASPGGPVVSSQEDARAVLEKVQSELRLRFAPFVRIEPSERCIDMQGVRKVVDERPSTTRILDLKAGAESVFSAMHEKTRYNTRLAEKKGVTVREVFKNDEDRERIMSLFHALLRQTATRDEFSLHPWLHYVHLIDVFCRETAAIPLESSFPTLRFYTAWHEEAMIAVILCMSFGDTVSYLHGASSSDHRTLMAPYALQWRAIREAIAAGYRYYDVWGVAPEGSPATHPWAGFTRFKQGFGGEIIRRLGTFDIPLNPLQYMIYSVARMIHRRLRRPIH